MSRKLLFILLATTLFFGCKKADKLAYYDVSGVHDVDLGDPANSSMNLNVAFKSGTGHDAVTLSVSGMPNGVISYLSKLTDTTSFSASLGFQNTYLADVSGTYPIKITAATVEGSKEYKANLTVPALNGYEIDGFISKVGNVDLYPFSTMYPSVILASETANSSRSLSITFNQNYPIPTTDGTYKIVGAPAADDEVALSIYTGSGSGDISLTTGATMQIHFVNGKMHITGYNISMVSNGHPTPFAMDFMQP